MESDQLLDTVKVSLAELGLDAATVARAPTSTIAPPARRGSPAQNLEQRLSEVRAATSAARFEVGERIGEGGMGVVRIATQRALGREVAIKSLRPGHRSTEETWELLREAWVTGSLEHPNVVPVYDVGVDADGQPFIVLKRIDGRPWSQLIGDAAAVRESFGAPDLLEWNLQILIQVAHAVRFAHSRGILHRDLKPHNVMIGLFGEVYLVDWGLAVSLHDDPTGRFPLARDARPMVGTPAYMAPEMVDGGARLAGATDIYLLGSVLCEIVTGHPPHRGESLLQILSSIADSHPELPPSVPTVLADIIRRAMHRDPAARYDSPSALQHALQDYLSHRHAAELTQLAAERREELSRRLQQPAEGPEVRQSIYRLFGECRFGYRHALEVWPEDEAARRGLDAAVVAMIDYELDQGQPEAAWGLLADMARVPEPLRERVALARQRRQAEQEELRRVAADLDPRAGEIGRRRLAWLVGCVMVLFPATGALIKHYDLMPLTQGTLAIASGVILVLLAALGVGARRTVMRTALNRRIGGAAALAIGLQLVAALLGLVSPLRYENSALLIAAAVVGMLCFSVDWRFVLSAIVYLVGHVVIGLVGVEYAYHVMTVANLVLMVNLALLWARWKARPAWGDG